MSGVTMAPIDRNNLCVNSLRACVRACPGANALNADAKPSVDVFTQLKQLKELVDTGVITPAEFDARKKLVLAR